MFADRPGRSSRKLTGPPNVLLRRPPRGPGTNVSERKLRLLWLIKGLGGRRREPAGPACPRTWFGQRRTDGRLHRGRELGARRAARTHRGEGGAARRAGWLDPAIASLASLGRRRASYSPVLASLVRTVARTVSPRPRLVYTEHNRWQSYRTVHLVGQPGHVQARLCVARGVGGLRRIDVSPGESSHEGHPPRD